MSLLNALTHFFHTSIAAAPSSVPETPEASINASSDPPYPSNAHNFTAARDDASQPALDDQADPNAAHEEDQVSKKIQLDYSLTKHLFIRRLCSWPENRSVISPYFPR